MAIGSFRVGQRLRIAGEACRINRVLDDGEVALEMFATGRYEHHRIADLLRKWDEGVLEFEGPNARTDSRPIVQEAYEDAFFQSYPEEAVYRAKAKLAYVTRLETMPKTKSLVVPVIGEIWQDVALWKGINPFQKPPHFTSVVRWIRDYEAAGRDIRALVDQDAGKGNRPDRIHEIVRKMVDDAIELEYLTLERPPLKEVQRLLKGRIALLNKRRLPSEQLRAPSYKYLRNRVQEMPAYDVFRARYGQRAADIKFRAAGINVLADRPLARASMDHTQLDLFVVDEATYLPLGRPWLTLVLDEHARYVLGYYVGFEHPSGVSMTRALRHAIGVKETLPDTQGHWDAWGVMDTLVVDNGMEFHGRVLEAGAGRYGINIQYCPRKKPWYKGKIERFFGTIGTGLLASLQGKTFSNIALKGDYDPAKHAVVTLQTLRKILEIWIVDIYHQDVHRGLGCSPQQKWTAGMEKVDCECEGTCDCKLDRYLPASSLEIDSAFSASEKRVLTHKGIEFDVLFYNSPELGELRELHGDRLEVEIRTQDDDLGSIIVVAPDHKTLIRVPALNQEYAAGLTRWQHGVCKRFQRRAQEDDAREISLLDAKQRIKQLIQEDMASGGRKSRTRVNQMRFGEQAQPTAGNASDDGIPDIPAVASPAKSPETPPPANTGDQTPLEDSSDIGGGDDIPDFEISTNCRRKVA